MTVDDQIAEGDKVVTRLTFRGTHRGELRMSDRAYAPTGKLLTFTWVSINKIAGGRVVETWVEANPMEMFRQLGV